MILRSCLRDCLWNYAESAKGKARVAWKVVCRRKEQGGVGIKPLQNWNEVLLLKLLWKIIEGKESLWVNWVNVVKSNNKSIWKFQFLL